MNNYLVLKNKGKNIMAHGKKKEIIKHGFLFDMMMIDLLKNEDFNLYISFEEFKKMMEENYTLYTKPVNIVGGIPRLVPRHIEKFTLDDDTVDVVVFSNVKSRYIIIKANELIETFYNWLDEDRTLMLMLLLCELDNENIIKIPQM